MAQVSVHESDWASMSSSVMSQALGSVPFHSKLDCEAVCKAWRRHLTTNPAPGVWGHRWYLRWARIKQPRMQEIDGDRVISLPAPAPKRDYRAVDWLSKRAVGVQTLELE